MTIDQQLMQTSPDKLHEIFARLGDTSATAVKTRERLFSELKTELDRHTQFEEQHLLPLLKEHEETKGLAAKALDDSRQTRKLLTEIERTPKDGVAFGLKVGELRDAFQRHLRDDSKAFLPAVVKALSDAEPGTTAPKTEEKTETETTSVEPAGRADKGEHLPADEHEPARAARQSADIMKGGTDLVQQGAQVARQAMTAGTETLGGMDRGLQSTATPDEAQAKASMAISAGASMMALLQEQARHALQDQTTMVAGRAQRLAELARMQSDFMAGSFQRMEKFNDRYRAFLRGWSAFLPFPAARR